MSNKYNLEETDLDFEFDIEEVEPVIAPSIGEDDTGYSTSIIKVCRCA